MFRFYSNLQSFRYIIGPGWCRGGGGVGMRDEVYVGKLIEWRLFNQYDVIQLFLCHVTQRDDYLHMYMITEKEVTENFVF